MGSPRIDMFGFKKAYIEKYRSGIENIDKCLDELDEWVENTSWYTPDMDIVFWWGQKKPYIICDWHDLSIAISKKEDIFNHIGGILKKYNIKEIAFEDGTHLKTPENAYNLNSEEFIYDEVDFKAKTEEFKEQSFKEGRIEELDKKSVDLITQSKISKINKKEGNWLSNVFKNIKDSI